MADAQGIRSIACVGEVMIELIAQQDGTAHLGVAGDTFNAAVYLARALRGSDTSVSYVTALGTDPYSDRIASAVRGHGIDTRLVERRAGMMPGLYAINTDATGERSFSYWRSASAARQLFSPGGSVRFSALDGFDLVLLSGISLAILPPAIREAVIGWADRFRKAGGMVAYDSNHRPQLWESADAARATNEAMWRQTDIALPSADDEMALFGDSDSDAVATRLVGWGVRAGALKRGASGPLDLGSLQPLSSVNRPVRVVDTTAAGDSFNAGYLAAMALGKTPIAAMTAGHDLACRVISVPGAIIPEQGAPGFGTAPQ